MTEANIISIIFENLVTMSPWAITVGGLVLYIFKQQEKTIERIENKNDKIVEDLKEEKKNYYHLLTSQGEMIQELKLIAEEQKETQKQMVSTMNNQGVQLEVIKTQIEYINKQRN